MKNESTLNLRLPRPMREYLDGVADAQMVSVADVVRAILLDKMPDEVKAVLIGEAK